MHCISIINWLHVLFLASSICMAATSLTLEQRMDKLEKDYVSKTFQNFQLYCIFLYINTYK